MYTLGHWRYSRLNQMVTTHWKWRYSRLNQIVTGDTRLPVIIAAEIIRHFVKGNEFISKLLILQLNNYFPMMARLFYGQTKKRKMEY